MERRNRKHALERVRVVVHTGAECLVQQQFKDEVDVNTIVRRFGMGTAPVYMPGGVYGDFTGVVDFESASLAVGKADAAFMQLPAAARAKFGNSPARFLDMAARVTEAELLEFCEVRAAPVVPVVPGGAVAPPVVPPVGPAVPQAPAASPAV